MRYNDVNKKTRRIDLYEKINVALVGAGFGGVFINIYKHHLNVGEVSLFDTDPILLNKVSQKYALKPHSSFEAILEDETADAVHIVTPIPLHEEQTVRVLEAGNRLSFRSFKLIFWLVIFYYYIEEALKKKRRTDL